MEKRGGGGKSLFEEIEEAKRMGENEVEKTSDKKKGEGYKLRETRENEGVKGIIKDTEDRDVDKEEQPEKHSTGDDQRRRGNCEHCFNI